jgi:hypothetical protein
MKQLFYKILFSISLLIFLQNHSLAQNIFDELKKAGEQLQKDINKPDVKQKPTAPATQQPPASATQQPSTDKSKTEAPSAAKKVQANFTLFNVKIADQISNIKTDNRAFTKDIDVPYFRVGAHVLFTPAQKNDLFEQYVLSYNPIGKNINKISGKLKKQYNSRGECEKEFKDIFKFVEEKNSNDNKEAIRGDPHQGTGGIISLAYRTTWELKEKVKVQTLSADREDYRNIQLDALCLKIDNKFVGWLELSDKWQVNDMVFELAELRNKKEEKDFQQKKDSGKLKGL